MREIKFRAWDTDTEAYRTSGKVFFDGTIESGWGHEKNHWILERFTGLHDKNGREIYEGDIVKYETPPEDGVATISSYIGNNLYFCWHNSPISPTNSDIFGCKDELEIVGNVHENIEDGA